MRIGLTGAQGTGKTTLLKDLIGVHVLYGHCFVPNISRGEAKRSDLRLNKEADFTTQKALTKNLGWHLKTLPNLVTDRTLLDVYAYTLYMHETGVLTSQQVNYVRTRARKHQPLFDLVIYLRPEFPVEHDGIRSSDPSYALAVAAKMDYVVKNEDLGTKEILEVTGDPEQRFLTVLDWLDNHK